MNWRFPTATPEIAMWREFMDNEIKGMKFDRKQFYAAVCIDLTAAFNGLPDYDFRTMAASVREYLRRLEKELDKCER